MELPVFAFPEHVRPLVEAAKQAPTRKVLPVTLLSGFWGALYMVCFSALIQHSAGKQLY